MVDLGVPGLQCINQMYQNTWMFPKIVGFSPQLIHVFHGFPWFSTIHFGVYIIPLILVETSTFPQMPPGKKQTKNLGLAGSQFIRLSVHHFSGNLPQKFGRKGSRSLPKKSIHTQTKHPPCLFDIYICIYIYIYIYICIWYIYIPKCSMYGLFTYIWVVLGVHVGKHTIHWASRICIYIYIMVRGITQRVFDVFFWIPPCFEQVPKQCMGLAYFPPWKP